MLWMILLLCISLINFDYAFSLIDNEFLPKNTKIIIRFLVFVIILAIAIRNDVLIGEWTRSILVYRYFYYLQHEIRSKHGLTKANYKKLSILARITEFLILKGCIVLIGIIMFLIVGYVTIRANKIGFTIIFLVIIYGIIIIGSTLALGGSIVIISIYYFKLLFDQINLKFEIIYKRSHRFLRLTDRQNLIWLTKKHNSIRIMIDQTNLVISKCICVLFIALAFMQIIPLNLLIETDVWFEKLFYLMFLFTSLSYGFGITLLFSIQINSAHKSYKTIYKILRGKRNLKFYFQRKVLNVNLNMH